MARQPYTANAAPVEITAKARRLPQWTLVDDSPGPLPVSPVTTKRAGRDGDAGALRRGQAAHHGVPVARVEAAGNSSPQMYLLNQS